MSHFPPDKQFDYTLTSCEYYARWLTAARTAAADGEVQDVLSSSPQSPLLGRDELRWLIGSYRRPRESMVVEARLWGAERWWKGQLDFVWCSSCLLVWLLVIGRIWERFIENETFVNYCSTLWGGSGGVCTLWSRSLRSPDVNTVAGKRGLFSCESLLVWFAEFTHPGSMKLITWCIF